MSRKLATVRKVSKLIPIKGADFIELAIVDGWQCIVKKGEFKKGDNGIYFEIDSMIPLEERYAFLGKATQDNTSEGYRIRTMKMRKQLSQGLMLPLHMFEDELKFSGKSITDKVGFDMTEKLGVWLYEPKMRQGSVRSHCNPVGMFPSFLRKTDQERIQNKMHYFDTYKDEKWEVSIKLDGSSMTVWYNDKAPPLKAGKSQYLWKNKWMRLVEKVKSWFIKPAVFGVCSRNINLKDEEGNAFWNMAKELELESKMSKSGKNVAIQGELIAPNIQSNHENVKRPEFYVFDVFDIDKQEYMSWFERDSYLRSIDRDATINHVPVVTRSFSLETYDFDKLQDYVTGDGMNKGVSREGYVFKSTTNPALSFKCISNDYLLKQG